MAEVRTVSDLEHRLFADLTLARMGACPLPRLAERYEIRRLLGRGARGLVVEAYDHALARPVALKLYPPVADDRRDREIQREAQALGQLEHPNIVRVFDVGSGELACADLRLRLPYISMELIRGENLRAWRQRHAPPRREVLRVLEEAAEGLAAAHAAGILHRDFKPENVMIDHRGRARVVDFGLAKGDGAHPAGDAYAPGDELGRGFTAAGTVVGTYEYLAPEARRGEPTAASDQYAFGLVAWEILAGEHPFDRRPADSGRAGAASPAGSERIPRVLRPVLLRALAPDASDRFPDMTALVRTWRRRSRRRRVVVLGTAAAGSAVLATVVGLQSARSPVLAASPPRDAPVPADADCAAASGRWYFNTVAAWSENARFLGANGLYELDLRHLGGCEFDARLRKIGSSFGGKPIHYADDHVRTGTAVAAARRQRDVLRLAFDAGMAAPKVPQAIYHFELEFGPEKRLTGTYAYRPRKRGPRSHAGYLRGGRTPLGALLPPAWDELPCRLACAFACPDEGAAASCTTSCEGEGLSDCGPPTASFVAPAKVRGLLAAQGAPPAEGSRDACAAAASALEGTWIFYSTGRAPERVSLSAEGCRLGAAGGPYDGGFVTDDGPWRLDRRGQPAVALAGQGPAFGLSADGRPVAAYRIREPGSVP